VRTLLERFVPCADEVWFLQNQKGPECDLFRSFCEKGHYGGRTRPTNTRQGSYAVAPSGEFLASINTNDPRAMAGMLRKALEAWKSLPEHKRFMDPAPATEPEGRRRAEARYPTGGLALKTWSRDLPRPSGVEDRGWAAAWNQDFAWFLRDEARSLLPESPEPGGKQSVPRRLVERIARFHLVDNVRGQTEPFPHGSVERAEMTVDVTAVEGDLVSIRIAGATRARQEMRTGVAGDRDMNDPKRRERGFEAKLLGRATFDLKAAKFTSFEMVAVGTRWGGTLYNGRGGDLDPAPIGVVFTLAADEPAERVAPAFFGGYGW
jgi:hypothetical protein